MQDHSRLAYLMDCFGITGKELARHLHVDHSLISKWRNIKRPLMPRSSYLATIADFFLSLESETGNHTIKELLMRTYPQLELRSSESISLSLQRWLTEQPSADLNYQPFRAPSQPGSLYTAHFDIYEGNSGRRHAIKRLLEFTLSLPAGQELFLLSQENLQWLYEDQEFLEFWKDKMQSILERGNVLTVIHTVDRLYQYLFPILTKWLPLHLTGKTEPCYFPKYVDTMFERTMFIIKDKIALVGMTAKGFSNNNYTYYYTDPITVAEFQARFQALLKTSKPLFHKFHLQENRILNYLNEHTEHSEYSIHFGGFPPLHTFSEQLFIDILQSNNVNAMQFDVYYRYYQQQNKILLLDLQQYSCRIMLDADHLESMLNEKEGKIFDLGCCVRISKQLLLQALEELIKMLSLHSNLEVAYLHGVHLTNFKGLKFSLKQDTFALACTADLEIGSPLFLATTEPMVVNAFFQYADEFWSTIARVHRDRETVQAKLTQLIQRHKKNI